MAGKYSDKKYPKAELVNLALEEIRKGGLVTFSDVVAMLPVGNTKFYATIKSGSPEWKMINDELQSQKRKALRTIRYRLFNMKDNITAQLAVYRMMCTDEERRHICTNHTDITTNGNEIQMREPLTIEIVDSTSKIQRNDDNK